MTNNSANSEIVNIKCPNPECGLILHSRYHTICPRCAEPFPISMLPIEKSKSMTKSIIILILLIIAASAITAFIIMNY